ncbi:MAG: hypothetical protein AAF771_14350 [Pseudomonadota bacterium]
MKTLIAAAAAALALTAPAYATVTDAQAHFASDFTSNDAKIYDGVASPATDTALAIHASLYDQDESNNGGLSLSTETIRMSSKGVANETAAKIFSDLAAENRNRD